MFSQIKDRNYTEHNIYSVARVLARGGTWGCWRGVKNLAWGFAMAPHRLRALVEIIKLFDKPMAFGTIAYWKNASINGLCWGSRARHFNSGLRVPLHLYFVHS